MLQSVKLGRDGRDRTVLASLRPHAGSQTLTECWNQQRQGHELCASDDAACADLLNFKFHFLTRLDRFRPRHFQPVGERVKEFHDFHLVGIAEQNTARGGDRFKADRSFSMESRQQFLTELTARDCGLQLLQFTVTPTCLRQQLQSQLATDRVYRDPNKVRDDNRASMHGLGHREHVCNILKCLPVRAIVRMNMGTQRE